MDTTNPGEIEARKMVLNRQVENLLASGLPVAHIAEIIGATDYLRVEERRGKPMATVFDTKRFVNDEVQKLTPLQLPDTILATEQVILPPGEGEVVTGGGEGMEPKELIPRSRYLVEVLTELKLPYSVVSGRNEPSGMRGLSYEIFLLPGVQKIVFVNNEEDNATFIVHAVEDVNEWNLICASSKKELEKSERQVTKIEWPGKPEDWKTKIKDALTTPQAEVHELETFTVPKVSAHKGDEAMALAELASAFQEWKKQKKGRIKHLSPSWLKEHGHSGLLLWCNGHRPLADLVALSSDAELGANFLALDKIPDYTRESALTRLEEAFEIWASLPEAERGGFNSNWLIKNGYAGLDNWSRIKGNPSLENLIAGSTNVQLKASFTRGEYSKPFTPVTALARLEEAYAEWEALSEADRKEFNFKWLERNGYEGLTKWTSSDAGTPLVDLVAASENQTLKDSFTRREHADTYTLETALEKVESAFVEWQALPEDERGELNAKWLFKHGCAGLSKWLKRNMSMASLVAKSTNQELRDNFVSNKRDVYAYTEATALTKLEEAFARWQALPESGRKEFNVIWLLKNGYGSLDNWCRTKGNPSLEDLIAKSGDDRLKGNFTRREKSPPYTKTTALMKVEEAFAKWQGLPKEGRSVFNAEWMTNNGYTGVVGWSRDKGHVSLVELVTTSTNQSLKEEFKRG